MELYRQKVPVPHDVGCNWCGTRKADSTLFRYFECQTGRWTGGEYCSKRCHDQSHG